jgi:hypothetical protein
MVLFPAVGGGYVAAEFVSTGTDDDGNPVPKWGPTSISIYVPTGAQIGVVEVLVTQLTDITEVGQINSENTSNAFQFTTLPPEGGEPYIESIDPLNAPPGELITITGYNFGPAQGGSTLTVAGTPLEVVTWEDDEIVARIPDGANSGSLVIIVNGLESNYVEFKVAYTPVITGVAPAQVELGDSLTIYGHHFGGLEDGTVTVGGTEQDFTTWNDSLIEIPALANFNEVNEEDHTVNVVVTSSEDVPSDPFAVFWQSNLVVSMTVDPQAGQTREEDGSGGTEFVFLVQVEGGDSPYEYELIPDKQQPSTTVTSSSSEIRYHYPYRTSPDVKEFTTQIKVTDANGDVNIADGPTVLVVRPGVPVITRFGLKNFNNAGTEAPTDMLLHNGTYYDIAFSPGYRLLTSHLSDPQAGGNPLAGIRRVLNTFYVADPGAEPNPQSRPYGYRYNGRDGSIVAVQGLNFGDDTGQLWLNANDAANITQITNFVPFDEDGDSIPDNNGWTNTEVRFAMPAVTSHLNGVVKLQPLGSEIATTTQRPLIASAYLTQVIPATASLGGQVLINGYDLIPDYIENITEDPDNQSVLGFWQVAANYTDPFTNSPVTGGTARLIHGIAPAQMTLNPATAGSITFEMGDLDVDGDGNVSIEVFNNDASQSQIVTDAQLANGVYNVMLWTGSLDAADDNTVIARSGIFSEPIEVNVGSTGSLSAVLSANPTSGDAPLTVDFDGSASIGDIVQYEFDPGDGTGWVDQGGTATYQHEYTADGDYTATLRVTSSGSDTDTDTVTISVGGAGLNADITATPSSGEAPLAVTLDASGSTGDIVKYEFDDGFSPGGWQDNGTNPVFNTTYTTEGTYQAMVRVTDGDANTDTDSVTVNVGTAPGNTVTINVTVNFGPYDPGGPFGTSLQTDVTLYETDPNGDPPYPIAGSVAVWPTGDGEEVTETITTTESLDTFYLVATRINTMWDGDQANAWVYGPFEMPPDHEVSVSGTMTDAPPPPD